MNILSERLPFDESLIDRKNYTASLLKLCEDGGLISHSHMNELRIAFDREFAETAAQYTKRASSSVSKKRAEILYKSVLFRCDVYLMSLRSTAKATAALESTEPDVMLSRGQELILRYYDECRMIFRRAYRERLDVSLYEYRYAMEKAFDEFAKNYSARFDAQNINTSIDYPLLHRKAFEIDLCGVMFIREYYMCIAVENHFCSMVDKNEILKLLNGYGMIYGCRYGSLLFNISEVVLVNMLAAALAGKPPLSISVSADDLALLYGRYSSSDEKKVLSDAEAAFLPCSEKMSDAMKKYLGGYLPVFASELSARLKSSTADKYIVISG